MTKRRIFIAVNFPVEIKQAINSIIDKIKNSEPNIKWVDLDNTHITLAFLGWVTEKEIARATVILKQISKNFKIFKINLGNIGFFPSINTARVVWIGSGENLNILNIQNNLNKQLTISGLKTEDRLFTPHLTIGRVKKDKKIKNTDKILAISKKIDIGEVIVSNIDIMESVLKKSGPEYKLLFRVNLNDFGKSINALI